MKENEVFKASEFLHENEVVQENEVFHVNELLPERNYKDRLFRMIFQDKKELLSLYNALNSTAYTDPEDLTITTLENAIYLNMKNDLSFLLNLRLTLYEQQSTINPNLPLRNLGYVSAQFEKLTIGENIYGSSLLKLPTPQFVVFYNGNKSIPERQILKLSDAYEVKDEDINLELKVLVLNINPGCNEDLMANCRTLKDYMSYVDMVRTYTKTYPLEDAVELAIRKCIHDGILADFLRKYRMEAKRVSIFEYNEEEHMKHLFAEGKEEGIAQGITQGEKRLLISQVLKKYKKGKTIAETASELEETESNIKEIYDLIEKNGNASAEEILAIL